MWVCVSALPISSPWRLEQRYHSQDANWTLRPGRTGIEASGGRRSHRMSTTLKIATQKYLQAQNLTHGTRSEYQTTLTKWQQWKGIVPIEQLDRPMIRGFLSWVYDRAVTEGGTNPGRTSNKARTHLRAVISWAWENDPLEMPPRFPKPVPYNNIAGRHYLTKKELNSLYFATHEMRRPKGWTNHIPVGRYWRAALVIFFNYGLDSGTVWGTTPAHEPILWRHVSWNRTAPNRQAKEPSKWGWLLYRRVKTGNAFCRPMNRVVHAHLKSLRTEQNLPNDPVFLGGSARPNIKFRELCDLAGIAAKTDGDTGEQKPWVLRIFARLGRHTTTNTCQSRPSKPWATQWAV